MATMKVYPVNDLAEDPISYATINDHVGNHARIYVEFGRLCSDANRTAARFAAGWNLLETLERMRAVEVLSDIIDKARNDTTDPHLRRSAHDIVSAIRTALDSKP